MVWLVRQLKKPYSWFEKFVKPNEDLGIKGLFAIFVIAVLVMLIVLSVDLVALYLDESQGPKHGTFGDFFGGLVNPFLTFFTFMGLLLTIVMQRVELRDSRAEMKRSADALLEQVLAARKQSFESTFLKLLEIHTSITKSIDLHLKKANRTVTGQDCMERFCSRLKTKYSSHFRGQASPFIPWRLSTKLELVGMYRAYWEPTRKNLFSWFNSICVILDYLDSESASREPYLSMFLAQLSEYEKILIFYHVSLYDNERLRNLVFSMDVLRDLPSEMLLHETHKELIPTATFS